MLADAPRRELLLVGNGVLVGGQLLLRRAPNAADELLVVSGQASRRAAPPGTAISYPSWEPVGVGTGTAQPAAAATAAGDGGPRLSAGNEGGGPSLWLI